MNTKKIAELNDKLRQNLFNSGKDKVILTQGVSNLPFDEQLRILIKVKLFNNFNEGNDPYQEHDFGMIEHSELKYFFKIDYYADDLTCGSDDPSNPDITTRVLTIMRADEY
ncbi:MAG: DUF3768 domain-containing protein [Alphaproteobacteria bacterium]|nr:DUF3768 domain-containing protein [Alphaproteobacteria bacterium]